MKTRRARAVLLAGAMVVATVLIADHPAQASQPQPTAVAMAMSPASGHLFAVSEILGKSWVSMVNARSGNVVHAVSVPTGTSQTLVDDRSGHLFLSSRDATVMLSTRTGRILSRLSWKSGNADMQALAGRLGFLYVTAGSKLHQIDTRTGRELRSAPLSSQPFASVAVQEGTAAVFTFDGAGVLRIYDARTLTLRRKITIHNSPPAFTLAIAPVLTSAENQNAVFLISGQTRQVVSMLDATSGAVRRTFRLQVPLGVAVALDAKTSHAFMVSSGNGGTPPETNGVVTTVDMTTGKVLRTAQLGAVPGAFAFDHPTNHLFVLGRPPVSKQGDINFWSAIVSMIDTRTGLVLHTTIIPETAIVASRVAVDSANHKVYVTWATSKGNSLTVLDSRTNTLIPRLFLASEDGR
ncbi:MAG TPA: PQQ-binding-like beta-propeller repeat protein [Chloroflexota bacterium]